MKRKINKDLINKISNNVWNSAFSLLNILGQVTIYFILILGSGASIILLYKLFPETAMNYFRVVLPLYLFFLKVMLVLFILIAISLFIAVIIYFSIEIKERHKKQREEFINEVVKELKTKNKMRNK